MFLRFLCASFKLNVNVELDDYKEVFCPADISAHGIGHVHILRPVVSKWFRVLAWRWYTVYVRHVHSSVGRITACKLTVCSAC